MQPLVLAGASLPRLAALAVELGPAVGAPTLIESRRPVERLTASPLKDGSLAVVYLSGRENVGDLLGMFKANPGVTFALLAPAYPPDGAVARVVADHHGAVLRADESAMVIAATLIALLSRRGAVAV